jgi:HIRAN domain
MDEFTDIFLSWRKGQGSRRHVVGLLQKNAEGKFSFSYDKESIKNASKEGFTPYTEFPRIEQHYNGNVLDIFAQRLIKPERPDIQNFYNFWEIDPHYKEDKFYLLGHTQGLLPTDNFEFLADYNIVDGLHFLTEIAALSKYKLPADTLEVGDTLRFEVDKKNEHDPDAVKIFKNKDEIGYVKKIHCRVFHKPGNEKLKLSVKAIDKNGTIKRVFVKVSL